MRWIRSAAVTPIRGRSVVLAELAPRKKASQFEATMTTTVEALEGKVTEFGDELKTRLAGFESFLKGLADDLKDNRKEMRDLREAVDGVANHAAELEKPVPQKEADGSLQPESRPPATQVLRTDPAATNEANGRRFDYMVRGQTDGILGSPPLPPAAGAHHWPGPTLNFDRENDGRGASKPKMDFPKFHGDDPKIWVRQCEDYFSLYDIQEVFKTRFATLNFRGKAALWLETVEAKQRIEHWGDLVVAVLGHWDKNKHSWFMRQILGIRQTTTVAEYIENFDELRHKILLQDPATSEVFFISRFIDGLSSEIRSAVVLQQPKDMDTVCSLAMLQEEELELNRRRPYHRHESREFSRSGYRYSAAEKNKYSREDLKKNEEGRKYESPKSEPAKGDSKIESLKAFRRSKGLCFTCGEKWSKTHTCPAQVPLHILEELLEACQISAVNEDKSEDDTDDTGDLCILQDTAMAMTAKRRTIRLQGLVGKRSVLILIDSSSTYSFVNQELADRLELHT